MDTLLTRFASKVNSVLTGFDRIVFKGSIRPGQNISDIKG